MKTNTPVVTFVAGLAALLVGLAVVFYLLPFVFAALGKAGSLLLNVVGILFTLAGLVSCVRSKKRTNLKVLWIIVMVLAPFFGPLLWFVWGKNNT